MTTPQDNQQLSLVGSGSCVLRNLPNLVILIWRCLRSEHVSIKLKGSILGCGVYVSAPLDLLPEMLLGVLGYSDDALIVIALLDLLLNGEEKHVVEQLWPGNSDDFVHLQAIFFRFNSLVTQFIRPVAAKLLVQVLNVRHAVRK